MKTMTGESDEEEHSMNALFRFLVFSGNESNVLEIDDINFSALASFIRIGLGNFLQIIANKK
jgi:hypothetical protein